MMDTRLGDGIVRVIRTERDKRVACLPRDIPDAAYDQWTFIDEPFINELCLMLLVALRHHVERELVWLAARVTDDGRELGSEEYRQSVRGERAELRRRGTQQMRKKLQLDSRTEWHRSMETLRLLANSYKHNPSAEPDEDLLNHLSLEENAPYAPLPESPAIKAAVVAHLGLQEGSDYCDVAEELMARTSSFLDEVRKHASLSPVRPAVASLNLDEFLR